MVFLSRFGSLERIPCLPTQIYTLFSIPPFSGLVDVGLGTTIGPYDVITGPAHIGPYSQLGQFVGVYGQDHPITYLTTYINQALFEGRLREHLDEKIITIGAGVWIGHGAVVLKGVNIGNGAIIGAGAIVTKDVPPFTIVAGNPAKVIRSRFSPEVEQILINFPWWQAHPDQLNEIEPFFHIDFAQDSALRKETLKKIIQTIKSN